MDRATIENVLKATRIGVYSGDRNLNLKQQYLVADIMQGLFFHFQSELTVDDASVVFEALTDTMKEISKSMRS